MGNFKTDTEAHWYNISVTPGKENIVKRTIEEKIERRKKHDQFLEILIPMKEEKKIVKGEEVIVEKRRFPGVIFIKMFMSEENWHLVRDTINCKGFFGYGGVPEIISQEEIDKTCTYLKTQTATLPVGSNVNIVRDPMKGFSGKITSVSPDGSKVTVLVSIFGRETPVEVDATSVVLSD